MGSTFSRDHHHHYYNHHNHNRRDDHHRNDPSSPWGGTKNSGLGRENGIDAFHEYTQTKSVVVNCSDKPFDWFVDDDHLRYS